ncbi:MAG: hypothetical protein MJ016_05740, partial [Victivallaceae bacterium]|nr:hypothetical protein [Victivallaceae bacterium]
RLLPYEMRGEKFDPASPFPDKDMLFERETPVFDPARNTLFLRATKTYADRKVSAVWAIFCTSKMTFSAIPDGWTLTGKTEKRGAVFFGFGFGADDDGAFAFAHAAAATDFSAGLAREKRSCRPALDVRLSRLPGAEKFFRVFPGYQRKLVIVETGREAMVRAANFGYHFFALWDDVYPIRDFLLFGEWRRARKMIRYMLDYPYVETCPWVTMHLIVTLGEYLAFRDDPAFARECFGCFKKYFLFCRRFVHPENGLLKTSLNCGVDNSREVGMDGLFYASCLNGWWYDSLRTLENLARECGDGEISAQCGELARRVEKNYAEAFFNEKEGYLRQARTENFGIPEHEVFQNTHTLGMDYTYGRHLFRRILNCLAAYQAEKLYHPMGRAAVAWNGDVPCEMWKAVHMSQHYGHECRTARCGGRAGEAVRLMRGFLRYFERYGVAIETLNLAGEERDITMTSRWQGFAATGVAQGILRGAAGLDWTRGGLAYVPAEDEGDVDVRGFRFRGVVCDWHISGKGRYVGDFRVNGIGFSGSVQIPEDVFPVSGKAAIEVRRSSAMPGHPVLLQAADIPVRCVRATPGCVEFTVGRTGRAPMLLFAAEDAAVSVDGEIVGCEFFAADKTLWIDRLFHAGECVRVAYKTR